MARGRGSSTMAALLLCAAAVLAASVPAAAHGKSDDGKKLTPPPSSSNPQQLAVMPEAGFYECVQSFPKFTSCAADIWNTITGKQPRLGKACCQVFGEFQDECIYKALRALNINVFGRDVQNSGGPCRRELAADSPSNPFFNSMYVLHLSEAFHLKLLAAGAHDILLRTEYILSSIPPSAPSSRRSRSKSNVGSNQPKDAKQGIQQHLELLGPYWWGGASSEIIVRDNAFPRPIAMAVAQIVMAIGHFFFAMAWPGTMTLAYESLSNGLSETASALVGNPMKTYQHGVGAGSALATAVWAAPAAAMVPACATARAIHRTLLGIVQSLELEYDRDVQIEACESLFAHASGFKIYESGPSVILVRHCVAMWFNGHSNLVIIAAIFSKFATNELKSLPQKPNNHIACMNLTSNKRCRKWVPLDEVAWNTLTVQPSLILTISICSFLISISL
ncbi:hypothetical protein ACLOJK_016511 [Asimina triloba]